MGALLLDRDDLHGNVPGGGVELQIIQHGPAEHVRQEDIEGDGGGLKLPREGQGRGAAGGDDAFEPFLPRQAQQDPGIMRIVFDDQQGLVAGLDLLAVVGDDFLARRRQYAPGSWPRPACVFVAVARATKVTGKI